MSSIGADHVVADFYDRERLLVLDEAFRSFLADRDGELAGRLDAGRADADALGTDEADLIVDLAPHLEAFLAHHFGIEEELARLIERHSVLDPVFEVRRNFVQRRALKGVKPEAAAEIDGAALAAELSALIGEPLSDTAYARAVLGWLENPDDHVAALENAARYAAWATLSGQGPESVLFVSPDKVDHDDLLPAVYVEEQDGLDCHVLGDDHRRRRQGFHLTDQGTDLAGALGEANYCIWCHRQGKDSCARGLRKKVKEGAAPFRDDPLGVTLTGCPLEERISEFQYLKAQGLALGALAVVAIDNPLVAATGHRICNDCMKACIYQRQSPANIPEVESRTLKDVLALPYGFEIYSLLTRWNPLDLRRPLPKAASGKRVLVVGMGPAGFTLAHHLLNEGHTVVGIDGLKIEPLDAAFSGVDLDGSRRPFEAIADVEALYEDLDDRIMAGFGGVAEYGITVRWDKNFLKLIRLLLQRRERFALFGGVRFGSTITLEDAWAQGFDHVALALGAGRPTILDLPNGLARGVRTASDFLMALQLTGAAKQNSIANMQLRLPVVVIGGGLTAIDTATESLAYYPRQVEKFLARYEVLAAKHGEDHVQGRWSDEERGIAEEFLDHARALRREREAAAAEGREPAILELLRQWGGVTIAYRKRLIDSPAYTLNHEEIEKALEEGVRIAERLSPTAVEVDDLGAARALTVVRMSLDEDGRWQAGESFEMPARSIFIAAGTRPNTMLARERALEFELDGSYFQARDSDGRAVSPEQGLAKPEDVHVLVSQHHDGRSVSFFGDLHPSFAGNVVKAMASATLGYPLVNASLEGIKAHSEASDADFIAALDRDLRASVERVEILAPNIVEVVVRAPAAARKFRPGQFYRVQNYETLAAVANDTRLAMEGLALTGAWVDREQGLLSLIVLEMGGSSSLCRYLKPGEPVVVMGPTGEPTDIPEGETVLLAGGGLGNAVLFSIGQALRAAGSRVLYFAAYRTPEDRYKVEEIEAAADIIVWCCEAEPGFTLGRAQDRSFLGNVVEAMVAYGAGELGERDIALGDVDRIVAIGSHGMMAAVAAARHGPLEGQIKTPHFAIGSINSPMQCMMKEICAQCLQEHVDPETGERSHVFSCANQDQPLDHVDWSGLDGRLKQNAVLEKLTAQWITHCLEGVAAE
ncbi:MAG: pyridine nucleotide-disulfide oxidoreductase [Rhodospirillaceae bacterium]|nr:pyridine nucleotide-disulfide oxidoreductase [Rhodospirillaceae bacterium]MDP6623545.1 FAD-dependent oxidoreductase [Alphaproteobacteria bacterium]